MLISSDYPFSSRAASYGDGCFTTISIENGQAELLSAHLKRLQNACLKLEIAFKHTDWRRLQEIMQQKAFELQSGIIKIIISAGNGGRGYSRNGDSEACCYFQTLPPVNHYLQWRETGISLGLSTCTLTCNPQLSGIKHLNRIEQIRIKQQESPFEDSIVLDEQGMVVEVSAANLFWCSFGRWFTPDLTLCGIEGVMRNEVLRLLLASNRRVEQVRAKPEALQLASDIFICNSLMKIVPVNRVCLKNKKEFIIDNPTTTKISRMLNETLLKERVREEALLTENMFKE